MAFACKSQHPRSSAALTAVGCIWQFSTLSGGAASVKILYWHNQRDSWEMIISCTKVLPKRSEGVLICGEWVGGGTSAHLALTTTYFFFSFFFFAWHRPQSRNWFLPQKKKFVSSHHSLTSTWFNLQRSPSMRMQVRIHGMDGLRSSVMLTPKLCFPNRLRAASDSCQACSMLSSTDTRLAQPCVHGLPCIW